VVERSASWLNLACWSLVSGDQADGSELVCFIQFHELDARLDASPIEEESLTLDQV
jgi:hypothetical protein